MFKGYLEATVGFVLIVVTAFAFNRFLGADVLSVIAGAALFRALLVEARMP